VPPAGPWYGGAAWHRSAHDVAPTRSALVKARDTLFDRVLFKKFEFKLQILVDTKLVDESSLYTLGTNRTGFGFEMK
jgi:hypothetical protein